MLQKFLRDARSLVDIAAADAQRLIHDGRIVEDKSLFTGGCAVGFEHFHFFFEQPGRQFTGIRNRRRTANEYRIATVKARNAAQAPQHVAEMASKNSAVGMKLIDYDVAEIFE